MIVLYKVFETGAAQAVFLFPCCILKIKIVDSQLVGNHGIGVVRYTSGHPVVTANGFQVPDFIRIGVADAAHFICPVFFQQPAGIQNAIPCTLDVRQDHGDEVLFPQSSGNKRIRTQDPGIRGDGLRCAHGHICTVDSRLGFVPCSRFDIRTAGVGHGIIREFQLNVRSDGSIVPGLLFRGDQNIFLHRELPRSGVVIARHQRAAIICGVFSNQNRCTGHKGPSFCADGP